MWVGVFSDVKNAVNESVNFADGFIRAIAVRELRLRGVSERIRGVGVVNFRSDVDSVVSKSCRLLSKFGFEPNVAGIHFGIHHMSLNQVSFPVICLSGTDGPIAKADDIAKGEVWADAWRSDSSSYELPSSVLLGLQRFVEENCDSMSDSEYESCYYFLPVVYAGIVARSCCQAWIERKLVPSGMLARVGFGYVSGSCHELGTLRYKKLSLKK